MHRPDGASLVSLFTTMIHKSALGALLTLASTVWYSSYAAAAGHEWLSPSKTSSSAGC